MEQDTAPYDLGYLAETLAALAVRLEPAEAARHAASAARAALRAMEKTTSPDALDSLARALAALAVRLEPAEAASAARAVVNAMEKTSDLDALKSLERPLTALAVRLEPAEAASAARAVVNAMEQATDPYALDSLARTLAALAGRLEPREAARLRVALSPTVVEALGKTIAPTDSEYYNEKLQAALTVLTDWPGPGEAADRAVVTARAIGKALSPPTRLSGLATLLRAVRLPPSRFSTQELVELLKMPTCVGPARDVILRLLGQRYNRPFADQWAFVDYAHAHLPQIDLTTPPKRPTFAAPR
jgi:hypothetical protein